MAMNTRTMTTTRTPQVLHTSASASPHAQRACAAFGLMVHPQSPDVESHPITPTNAQLDAILGAPITLIIGQSGSGKSRRLAGINCALESRSHHVHRVQPVNAPTAATFDAFDGSAEEICASLAMSGLAEPRLWAMPANTLSTGQRARLELAVAIHRAKPGDVVLADEFCTPLDRVCAASVCATVRRWVHQKQIHFIAASAHEDLAAMLAPTVQIHGSTGEITTQPITPTTDPIRYENGTIHDYDQLKHLHYLGGRPATYTQIIRAIRTSPIVGEILAGVLVVSMPTLNGAWRQQAWPGRYTNANKRLAAQRINRELRCLSRVVVEPASRGLGIASGLVHAYMQNPQTPATEAIAAMGSVCPFFVRAGMTQYTIALPTPHARLLDALHYANIKPTDLIKAEITKDTLVHRELMHWARSTRMLRDSDTPVQTIALMAACKLLSRPRAYAWRKNGEHNEHIEPN